MPPLDVRVCENGTPAVIVGKLAGDTTIDEAGGRIVRLIRTVPKSLSSNQMTSLVAELPLCA